MTVSEAELRRAVNVLDQYRAQLDGLRRQQEIVAISLEEMLRARETLTRYQRAGKGAEILVPIGADAYVYADVAEAEHAIVGIGSDLLVEEPVSSALERLDRRIKGVQEAAAAISARVAELDNRVQAQSEFVQGVYERLSEQPEGGETPRPS